MRVVDKERGDDRDENTASVTGMKIIFNDETVTEKLPNFQKGDQIPMLVVSPTVPETVDRAVAI